MKKMRAALLRLPLVLTGLGALGLALNRGGFVHSEEPPAVEATPPAEEPNPIAAPPSPDDASAPTSDFAEYVGAESCAACHSEQVEGFKSDLHGKKLEKVKGIPFEKSCETCHGPGGRHVNAAGDKTNPDFSTIKAFKKMGARAVADACFQCHQDADKNHWIGSPHERADVSCAKCHSVHAAKGRKGNLIQATEASTCYTCHGEVKGQMRRSAHMPVAEGKMSCSSCHNPHGTAGKKQINAASINQLCYSCHQDKRGPFLWEHLPVRENCSNCHHPHGSHYDKMLTAKQPFLCQRCHAYSRHPGTIYDAASAKNQRSQIFGQSCYACHANVHGSNHPAGKAFTR